MAEEKADDVALTVRACRGLARLLRLRGHLDEAAAERNDGVWQTLKDHVEGMINRDTARLVQSGKNETPHQAGLFLGAEGQSRTDDLLITNQLLYH